MTKTDLLGKSYNKLLNKKLFLFDIDGTILLSGKLFDGVKEFFNFIKSINGEYVFVTNNSSNSVSDLIIKLHNLGLDDVSENNFMTSIQATISIFKEKFNDKLIYAQGTSSFIKQLVESGLNITTCYDEHADVVLVGFDSEITGEKLRNTCHLLTVKNIPYYATNPDWVCPVDYGFYPDCGSLCFMIEKATGKKPIFIGKPEPFMLDESLEKFNCDKQDAVMFGDRLYTDIAFGVNAGIDTVLVLTGEATMEECKRSSVKPDYVFNSIKDIL